MKTVFADAHYKATYQLGAVNSVLGPRASTNCLIRLRQLALFCWRGFLCADGQFWQRFCRIFSPAHGVPHQTLASGDER